MVLGPQFEQLKMFMTPREIKNTLTSSFDARYLSDQKRMETMDEMWSRKLQESFDPYEDGTDLYHSIRDKGLRVQKPFKIEYGKKGPGSVTLADGHHRIATGVALENEIGETYIPVTHTDFASKKDKRKESSDAST